MVLPIIVLEYDSALLTVGTYFILELFCKHSKLNIVILN